MMLDLRTRATLETRDVGDKRDKVPAFSQLPESMLLKFRHMNMIGSADCALVTFPHLTFAIQTFDGFVLEVDESL